MPVGVGEFCIYKVYSENLKLFETNSKDNRQILTPYSKLLKSQKQSFMGFPQNGCSWKVGSILEKYLWRRSIFGKVAYCKPATLLKIISFTCIFSVFSFISFDILKSVQCLCNVLHRTVVSSPHLISYPLWYNWKDNKNFTSGFE